MSIYLAGKDGEDWGGHYGAVFSNIELRVLALSPAPPPLPLPPAPAGGYSPPSQSPPPASPPPPPTAPSPRRPPSPLPPSTPPSTPLPPMSANLIADPYNASSWVLVRSGGSGCAFDAGAETITASYEARGCIGSGLGLRLGLRLGLGCTHCTRALHAHRMHTACMHTHMAGVL